MSLRTPDLQVEIAVANMDLYPVALPGHPSWGSNLEELVSYLETTGCRNFEIHPTQAIVEDVERRAQTGDTELADKIIGSFHQTFNEGIGLLGRVADWRGLRRAADSVEDIDIMQSALSRPVPGVYYANLLPPGGLPERTRQAVSDKQGRSREPQTWSTVQPSAELDRDFKISSAVERTAALGALGIIGSCPDTAHWRRRAADGSPAPADIEDWATHFASGRVFQMHISTDRTDMAKRDQELAALSKKEFETFIFCRWPRTAAETEMGQMIVAAVENWVPPAELAQTVAAPIFRMVVEVPPRLSQLLGRTIQHTRFVRRLADVIHDAGAGPLLWNS